MQEDFFFIGAEVEDLTQEGMIGLVNALNSYKFDQEASFNTYARLCIKRKIISTIKKSNTKKSKFLSESLSLNSQGNVDLSDDDDDEKIILVFASNDMLPDDKIIWQEKLKDIKMFIEKKLSSYEKTILAEFLKGLSYEQISKNVKKSKDSVENALSRIRTKLLPLKTL